MRSSGIPQTTWLCCSLILVCALVWHPFPRPLRAEQKAIQTRQVPVDSLIFDLKNPDPVRRRDAARLLGENKIQRAIPDLVATAGDADATVRRAVITALAAMEDIGALPAFVNRMGDSEKDIRQKCIQVVVGLHLPKESGFMASVNRVATFFNPWSDEWAETVVEPGIRVDPSVIEALRKRLDDPDEGLRVESCRALGILRGREVAPDMAALLQKNASNELRLEAIRSLRKIGDPARAPAMINYLNYSDYKVRNEAVYATGRLRYRPAVPELTRLFESEMGKPARLADKQYQEKLLDALAYIADPSSKELFAKERRNPDNLLRQRAVEGTARIGDESMAAEISRAWLAEKEAKVQTALSYALYRMGRREYADDLVNKLSDSKTREEARQYLVEFRPDEVPELYSYSGHPDGSVREALAEIYGHIGDSRAIPVLQEMARDSRSQVVAAATQALRRITTRTAAP